MTNTKHIRKLYEEYADCRLGSSYADNIARGLMTELPGLLDELVELRSCCQDHTEAIGDINVANVALEKEVERLRDSNEMLEATAAKGCLALIDAKSGRRWIPVGERLPPDETDFLGRGEDDGCIDHYRRLGDECHNQNSCNRRESFPAHWMPLPAAPEGE